MNLILIIICVVLFFCIRLLDAIKSGCFYAADRQANPRPVLIERFMKNMHYVQTPLWYCVFGAFGILLFIIFTLLDQEQFWTNILAAILISYGTSAMCGPLYQGYINTGGGESFVNPNEKKYMEFAIPVIWKTIHVNRFWYGMNRIYLAFLGLAEVVIGLLIIFTNT